jgi:Spy/CpxP family protein refolding chaperone
MSFYNKGGIMVKKGTYILLIALLVASLGFFSGCRRGSHAHKADFILDYIVETLDLTENQQKQLNLIKDELMEKGEQMKAGRESMHEEIVAQLGSEEINQARMKNLIAERRAQIDEFIDLALARLVEFHKTLTPEQRDKLVAKIETFKRWHSDGWD